ncbi:hypothetical protein ACIGJO_30085 [Streptomyces sp. NPDC079020]|uniref:hypothetical protein n=1 Tax=Streptomyces sp. NPDC079020 TaxID=3365722 RepID=UPI0037D41557
MDDQRQGYEQTYTELLGVVARLDALRRRGGRELDPMATAAMHASSHAAWTLWRAMRREVTPPLFADLGDEFLDLAREWTISPPPPRAGTNAAHAAVLAWDGRPSMMDPG